MTTQVGLHEVYDTAADSTSAINWVNNGSFMFFDQSLAVVEDINTTRAAEYRRFDVLDPTFYRHTSYAFNLEEKATSEFIGSWLIYGAGSIIVNPIENGVVVPSYDGGNLLQIHGTKSGSITMDQELDYFYPLLGSQVTLALSGRKVTGIVKVELQLLIDDEIAVNLQTQSQFFGSYRRFSLVGKCPEQGNSCKIRIKLTGTGNWSVGLSGISLALGPLPFLAATPSLADLVVPKGTVVITTGATCPSGYKDVESDGRMALVSGGPSNFVTEVLSNDTVPQVIGVQIQKHGGNDYHDHNPDGQIDCLEEPSNLEHVGPESVPDDGYQFIHAVGYHASPVVSWYAHDRPSTTLGILHTHRLTSKMKAIPPNFSVKYCQKL